MKKIIFLALGACFCLTACQQTEPPIEQVAIDSAHSSENALDWAGVYRGTLPCADCPGIDTELTLDDNQHYTLREQYRGHKDVFISEGEFMWTKGGQKIQLDEHGDNRLYFVGENSVWAVGADGQRVQGELADAYILQKISPR